MGPWWAILSIATSRHEVRGDDTARSQWITTLTKTAIGVDLAGTVVGVVAVAGGSPPVAVSVEQVTTV